MAQALVPSLAMALTVAALALALYRAAQQSISLPQQLQAQHFLAGLEPALEQQIAASPLTQTLASPRASISLRPPPLLEQSSPIPEALISRAPHLPSSGLQTKHLTLK